MTDIIGWKHRHTELDRWS